MEPAFIQLIAVVLGGLIAMAGGVVTALVQEGQKRKGESHNLALAFRGEIAALLELIRDRHYVQRLGEVRRQIEETQEPFYMPIRVRFQYDRVYDSNVERIGILKPPLPELIPRFYTRITSVMEDLVSLGDGTYGNADLALLLRIYGDAQRMIEISLVQGEEILAEIGRLYDLDEAKTAARRTSAQRAA
jgi:hypothetical protein